jgi:hypothetical protein
LLFGTVEVLEACVIEEISKLFAFGEDAHGHFLACVLKLDDEIHENLVFVLGDREFLPCFPKLFGHPVGDDRRELQILHEAFNVLNLLVETARQPQLSPRSPFLVLKYQSQ